MILNVSGRTDVVAFYFPWFLSRLKEGYFDSRNPFDPKLVSRIYTKDIDAIVFVTKNPIPLSEHLDEIDKPMLLQVTITPYGKEIEPGVANKKKIIEAVKKISSIIGKENVSVRYDPIFLSPKYDAAFHVKAFTRLAEQLKGYVHSYIVSFMDECKNVLRNKSLMNYRDFQEEDYALIGKGFSLACQGNEAFVQTCFEHRDLVEYGFVKADCISREVIAKLTGKIFPEWKARKDQEKSCHCVQIVDIGAYNCCPHRCAYCYANYSPNKIESNCKNHHVDSSLLIGELEPDDRIIVRKDNGKKITASQLSLLD